jgi:RimJ/RimL family protein N-acetyltransferase
LGEPIDAMPKRTIHSIANEKILLRLVTEADLDLTLRWRNQDHIRRWFFTSSIIDPEQHHRWFEQYIERDDDFVFVIEELATQRPIGQVALYHVDWDLRRAEFGRLMIGESDAMGKGFARSATELAIRIAFVDFKLRQLYLEVYAHNTRARAIYESTGFQVVSQQNNLVTMIKNNEAN